MFIFGAPEEMKERIGAFVEGGVTLPILTPIATPDQLADLITALARHRRAALAQSRIAKLGAIPVVGQG